MNLINKLRLDSWWNLIMYLGVLLGAASLKLDIKFIENKNLFGLSLGMIMLGISFWIAEKEQSAIKPSNAYTGPAALISWREIHHNFFSLFCLVISIFLILIFGIKVVIDLM